MICTALLCSNYCLHLALLVVYGFTMYQVTLAGNIYLVVFYWLRFTLCNLIIVCIVKNIQYTIITLKAEGHGSYYCSWTRSS